MWTSRGSRRRDTFNRPSARTMIRLGGMTYTRFGSRRRLFPASLTGIDVARESTALKALSCVGSKCDTSTNASPGARGRFFKSCVVASNPPADAPMPTTGNEPSEHAAAREVVRAAAGFALRCEVARFTLPLRPALMTFIFRITDESVEVRNDRRDRQFP